MKDKKGSKRKASSAESNKDKDDDHEEVEGDETADSEHSPAQGGNEFGRGAHKKAKKKVTISAVSTTHALPTSRTIRHVMAVTRRVVMDSSKTRTRVSLGVIQSSLTLLGRWLPFLRFVIPNTRRLKPYQSPLSPQPTIVR